MKSHLTVVITTLAALLMGCDDNFGAEGASPTSDSDPSTSQSIEIGNATAPNADLKARLKKFFDDLEAVTQLCEIERFAFDTLVANSYQINGPPSVDRVVPFFAYEEIELGQMECVENFVGPNGYRFHVIEHDVELHADA